MYMHAYVPGIWLNGVSCGVHSQSDAGGATGQTCEDARLPWYCHGQVWRPLFGCPQELCKGRATSANMYICTVDIHISVTLNFIPQ